jgi:hypothetical protein
VYSDSGFKYASPIDGDNAISRGLDPCINCGRVDCDCGDTYWCDCPCLFPIWDFSFFSSKRRKHYRILNENVFTPLTKLQLENRQTSREFILDDYRYIITNLPSETSKIYKRAIKHIQSDNVRLDTLLTELRTSFATHNDLLDKTTRAINDTITRRLTSTHSTPISSGGSLYNYDMQEVKKYLSQIWRPSGGSETITDTLIARNINRSVRNRDPTSAYFVFNNFSVGRGTMDEFHNMSIALDEISRDPEITELLSEIEDSADNLLNQITEIKGMAREIKNLIDQQEYDTKIFRCCKFI